VRAERQRLGQNPSHAMRTGLVRTFYAASVGMGPDRLGYQDFQSERGTTGRPTVRALTMATWAVQKLARRRGD
jgi:hypothetical protein